MYSQFCTSVCEQVGVTHLGHWCGLSAWLLLPRPLLETGRLSITHSKLNRHTNQRLFCEYFVVSAETRREREKVASGILIYLSLNCAHTHTHSPKSAASLKMSNNVLQSCSAPLIWYCFVIPQQKWTKAVTWSPVENPPYVFIAPLWSVSTT